MSRQITLENLHNTRDLGGMRTVSGRRIKDGMLIRSGHLYGASQRDCGEVAKRVELLVDLRSEKECLEKPEPQLAGVRYCHLPILDSLTVGITRERQADGNLIHYLSKHTVEAEQYMCDMYRNFVRDVSERTQYAQFVRLLFDKRRKALLWHCTAGKDRAGIAAVIVEELLGVPRQDIYEDYMMTNVFQKEAVERLTKLVSHNMRNEVELTAENLAKMHEAMAYLFTAREAYLDAFYGEIDRLYGNFDAFARKGLDVDADARQTLGRMYLA